MRQRLFIVCSGETSTSRTNHLEKITRLASKIFQRIVVVSEDMPIKILNRNEYWRPQGKRDTQTTTKNNMSSPLVLRYVKQELRKSRLLFTCVSRDDVVLFLGVYQPLSLLAVKLRHGSTFLFGGGFDTVRLRSGNKRIDTIYFFLRWAFQLFMLKMFRKTIVESPSVTKDYNLNRFKKRILSQGHLFVDHRFFMKSNFCRRDIDVAYVGVLCREKGIAEFLESVGITARSMAMKALVLGDGELRPDIGRLCRKYNSQDIVTYTPYVREMPRTLRRIRLLVIPSSCSEGLPNRLIEAMACGTPVLATTVGGIPDVLKEGKTGFLLASNRPEHVAERITELLRKPDLLRRVGACARQYAMARFSFEKTLQSWRRIFESAS